jgi:hypothetical protein
VKKLLLTLLAIAALATPAAASAHHHWFRHHHALLAKVSGTGTAFTGASATASGSITRSDKLANGTFAASISTDWTKATTRTGDRGTLSCAPATATVTLTGTNAADKATGSLTGKTCKWTPTTGDAVSAFFGRGTVTGAGALASLTNSTEKAFLVQKADGTVTGAVFAGMRGMFFRQFQAGQRDAEHHAGDCGDH